jgi:peptidoglycan/LPS O-acetylase OafA/YrhL
MTTTETKQPPVRAPRAPISPSSETVDRRRTASLLDYRPDIDGLRAVAVLAVIGFHAFPTWIRGGFVGVDVFFVISGFLISTILLADMERGSFRFAQFYIRRIKRIFPALIVILLAAMAAGWFLLFSSEYKALGKHVAGSAAFVSNFVLWNETGYFDKAAETKPLLHIWSLGIEEQFYIIWPLLLYLTWKRKAATLTLLLLLLVVSFAFNVSSVVSDQAASFYSPLARFWELMVGALLAYLALHRKHFFGITQNLLGSPSQVVDVGFVPSPLTRNFTAVTGLILIVASALVIDDTRRFPGWWALLPVAGTFLLVAAGPHTWINGKVLSTRGLVAIGLISYPLYLWHWPLLSFIQMVNGAAPSPVASGLTVLLSFALASLTYLLVERPLRFGKSPPAKAAALLVVVMLAVGSAGYFIYMNDGFAFRNSSAEDIVAATRDYEFSNGLTLGNADADETILVGDSTMEQYIPRVRRLIEQHIIDLDRNRIVFDVQSACPPIPDIGSDQVPRCEQFVDKVLPALDGDKVKTVVFAAWWTAEFTIADYYYLRADKTKALFRDSEAVRGRALDKFSALISHLVALDKKVFVLLETPSGAIYDPEKIMPTGWGRLLAHPRIPESPTRSNMEKSIGIIDQKIQRAAEAAGARVIKPLDYLCYDGLCPITDKNGHLMYFNYGHLRGSYVRDHATYIDQIFRQGDGPSAR